MSPAGSPEHRVHARAACWGFPSGLKLGEKAHQIPMMITLQKLTANLNGRLQLQQVGLADENLLGCLAKVNNLPLCELHLLSWPCVFGLQQALNDVVHLQWFWAANLARCMLCRCETGIKQHTDTLSIQHAAKGAMCGDLDPSQQGWTWCVGRKRCSLNLSLWTSSMFLPHLKVAAHGGEAVWACASLGPVH